MTESDDRALRKVEQVLEWVAGADGVAFLIEVSGHAMVRGDATLALMSSDAIDDVAGQLEPCVKNLPLEGEQAMLYTRGLPHGWVIGGVWRGRAVLGHQARLLRAASVLAQIIRPSGFPSSGSPGPSSAPPTATALLGLPVRRGLS